MKWNRRYRKYPKHHESRNRVPQMDRPRQQPGKIGQHGDAVVYESHGVHQQHGNYRTFADNHGEYVRNWVQTSYPPTPVGDQPMSIPATPFLIPTPATTVVESPRDRKWILIMDPFLSKTTTKVYRFDGVVPNDPSYPEPIVQDPRLYRSKTTIVKLPIELPVPKFKIDKNYIRQRPEVEVTFTNLNDNVNKEFLTDLVLQFGQIELLQIYYHPITKNHLGLAKIIFKEAIAAKNCVQRLNNTSVMGKVVNVFLDSFAIECKSIFEKITEVKSKLPEEESLAKYRTKENSIPCTNYNFDNTTPYQVNTGLQSEQPYSTGYYSVSGAPGNNDSYNRYPSNIFPSVSTNHLSGECNSASSLLPSASVPESKLDSNTQFELDLDTILEMFLNERSSNGASVEPEFLSVINEDSENVPEIVANTIDYSNLNLSPVSDNNNYQSDLDDEVKTLPLSNPPSSFSSKNVYEVSTEQLKIIPEIENCEEESFFDKSVREVFSTIIYDSFLSEMSFSDDEVTSENNFKGNTPDYLMSSSEVHTNTLTENLPLPNYPSHEYYNPSQFKSLYDYICPLPKAKIYKPKPQLDRHDSADSHKEIKKHLMKAVTNELKIKIKQDLMQNMATDIAFNVLNQWWEKEEKQSKSSSITFKEHTSAQLPPNLDSILDAGSEALESSALQKAVTNELRIQIKQDLMQNMATAIAFNVLDQWWEKEENQSKSSSITYKEHTSAQLPPNLDSILDAGSEALESSALQKAVTNELRIQIKQDLMQNMATAIAFNVLDQWWEKEENQSKSSSITYKEHTSAQLPPNLDSILDGGSEALESSALQDLGLGSQATLPKMPSFRRKEQELSSMKTNKQEDDESDQEEMVITSDNKRKDVDNDEVTSPTFEECKRLRRKLFDNDCKSSTSELSVHNSTAEENSSDNNDKSIGAKFVCQNKLKKLCNSITFEDFDRVRELTPDGNEIPMFDFSSFDEGSFNKYKVAHQNLNALVESKQCLLNRKKTPTKDNSKTIFPGHSYSMSQEAYSPPSITDCEREMDKKDTILPENNDEDKMPIILSEIINQSLAGRDIDRTENTQESVIQKYHNEQVKCNLKRRDILQNTDEVFEFFTKGLEDINHLKQSYDSLSTRKKVHNWLNESHRVSHPITAEPKEHPPKINKGEWKIHNTGSARTEGFYKVDSKQKSNYKYNFGHSIAQLNHIAKSKRVKQSTRKVLALSREVCRNQIRSLRAFGVTLDNDLLKFKGLKLQQKQLKFGKSDVHDWGLFAMESIAADEVVIEYVGEIIRPIVADLREQQYEAAGIGCTYFFRLDIDTIIDATKRGNLAKFINHSCNPNCYAKVVQIEGKKKIVIYSKQSISVNEEITYDYKFPLEEKKIPCLCGSSCCHGTLN